MSDPVRRVKLLRRDRRRCGLGGARLLDHDAARPEHATVDYVGKRHRAQVEMDLVSELFPEIVRQTSGLVAATADGRAGRAARGADRLVDREDDVGYPRTLGAARQQVAAA